jgi:uncharacterized membrane protein
MLRRSLGGRVYLLLKTVHILSVVLFLGNIVTGIFWKAHADATRDPRIQAHALEGINRSDAWFTMPAVFAIIVSGVALAMSAGLPILGTDWILASLIAFGLSGLLFGVSIAPLQRRLLAAARAAEAGAVWPSGDYRRMSVRWEVTGIVAILLPLAALAMMVFKPDLPF